MAEMFNPKEDVLEIELTPYGTKKLKEGVLEPIYYSFHDDEVYYGDDDTDNIYKYLRRDDFNRIYRDSAYISSFKAKHGSNGSENSDPSPMSRSYFKNKEKALSYYNTSQSLGKSKKGSNKASAIALTLYDKDVSIRDVSVSIENIKEIELGEVNYYFKVKTLSQETVDDDEFSVTGEYATDLFEDETFIDIEVPDILFSIDEANVQSEFENFEIEVYEYDDADKTYVPLLQPPIYQEGMIKDGLLIDDDNENEIDLFMKNNPRESVINDSFFIETDDEIPGYILEKYFKVNKETLEELQDNPVDIYNNTLSGPFGDNC